MIERVRLGGTDGFRGCATTETGPGLVNTETFAGATAALVAQELELGKTGPVIVSQDTRDSGEALRRAAINGALLHGVEVWDLGVAPTPMAQKISQEMDGLATIVVTASHNPPEYNGWKGMIGSDKPMSGAVDVISARYWDQVESGLVIPHDNPLEANEKPDLLEWYIHEVVADIAKEFGDKPLENKLFVIDGAYGAAQIITPEVFRRLGAVVEEYCCDGRGSINSGCGATHLGGVRYFLIQHPDIVSHPHFVGAIANDGDGDRIMAVGAIPHSNDDWRLVELNGNYVMGALAQDQTGIVGTEYTNSGLAQRLQAQGIGFEYCPNGDIFVTQALRQKQNKGAPWTRGGEFTGHHVDTEWLSSGDGIRMAAWLASYAASKSITFGHIYQDLPLWAEKMAKVKVGEDTIRDNLEKDIFVRQALARATNVLGKDGRLILRPSGTEPVVRIWGEGRDLRQISSIVVGLASVVRSRARTLLQ